jgi:hypothetical protein
MEPEPVTSAAILLFLQRLGERWQAQSALYLLGGGALCLLGNPRETRDLDYSVEATPEVLSQLQMVASKLAAEMQLDLEEVPLGEFVPLPPDAEQRRRFVGRFGQLDVYIFDPYSIALSKIARGFESDLDDVMFMLGQGLIEFSELELYFESVLPKAAKFDIEPREFRQYFEEIRARHGRSHLGAGSR